MTPAVRDLKLPLSEEQARSLKLGEVVTLSGAVFTGRSLLHIRAIEQDILPPLDFEQINAFFHVGPVMRRADGDWEVVSIEPTSSIRFEKYSGELIRRLKLRTLIGKTTMGAGTAAALKEVGGVHLTKIGICGNLLKKQIRRVREVHFLEELGKTEATWVFEVEKFGPFFVDIDAAGQNYFETLLQDAQDSSGEAYRELGIEDDFEFTNVNFRCGSE